ncbi:MAG: phosphomannomutase/phosphoglucomutase [Candidatus Saccharibacteria bacterium]
MKFDKDIFKAYDIRGLSPEELSPKVAFAIGRAFADFVPTGKIAVGRDMRSDSAELAEALIAGLLKQGREVINLGLITSDTMYFAVGSLKLAGGAMITASHNPGAYDGIKLTGLGVVPIGIDSGLLTIEEEITADTFKNVSQSGTLTTQEITSEWIEHALNIAGKIHQPLKIGIDFGNGMASLYLKDLQAKTPLHIDYLYETLDGTFPNHVANPLLPENTKDIRRLVKSRRLECGIAFDGDGDRAFFCDESGTMLSGSELGALLAIHILKKNPGATILYNAVCSRIVPQTIEVYGGKAIRTKVGHSFIKAEMRKHTAVFACEHSGHFYFADNYNADSGLIAALMLLHVLSASKESLSEMVAPLRNQYIQSGEINITSKDIPADLEKIKQAFSDGKIDELDGITINYPHYWVNVRPSNTEPLLRINIEAEDPAVLESTKQKIEHLLAKKPLSELSLSVQ